MAPALQDALIAFRRRAGSRSPSKVEAARSSSSTPRSPRGQEAEARPRRRREGGRRREKLTPGLVDLVKAKASAINEKAVAQLTEVKDGTLDVAAKVKAVRALRAEVGQKLSTGNLAVLADIDAWLKENAAAAPAK
jgi:hypothetical protein